MEDRNKQRSAANLIQQRFQIDVLPELTSDQNDISTPADDTITETFSIPEEPAVALTFPPNAVPGEVVVQFENEAAYQEFLKRLESLGIDPIDTLSRLYALRLPSRPDILRLIAESQAEVAYNIEVVAPPLPVDRSFGSLASLVPLSLSGGEYVGDSLSGTGRNLVVAVLDSGLLEHSSFANSDIESLDFTEVGISGPGAEHGTAVASVISGDLGIAPDAKLLAYRVLDENGSGDSFTLSQAILAAVDNGADIINLSLGQYGESAVLEAAIEKAREQDVLVVAAVGNDGYNQIMSPSDLSTVFAVTAVDGSGQHARFPNQSENIDLAAPGVGIITATSEDELSLFSGTSAATPMVTGLLAALASDPSNPRTVQESIDLIQSMANDKGPAGNDQLYGGGSLDIERLQFAGDEQRTDLAISDIHLPSDSRPGTTMPVEIVIQNQGNAYSGVSQIEYIHSGASELTIATIPPLQPNQSVSQKIFVQLPNDSSNVPLEIGARIKNAGQEVDARPENDVRSVRFRALSDAP